jgi:hypothetical protein
MQLGKSLERGDKVQYEHGQDETTGKTVAINVIGGTGDPIENFTNPKGFSGDFYFGGGKKGAKKGANDEMGFRNKQYINMYLLTQSSILFTEWYSLADSIQLS